MFHNLVGSPAHIQETCEGGQGYILLHVVLLEHEYDPLLGGMLINLCTLYRPPWSCVVRFCIALTQKQKRAMNGEGLGAFIMSMTSGRCMQDGSWRGGGGGGGGDAV